MFFSRNDFLCRNESVFGPWEYSRADYRVSATCGTGLEESLHANGVAPQGRSITVSSSHSLGESPYDITKSIVPSMESDPDWYTVCGMREPDYRGDSNDAHSAWHMLHTRVFLRQSFIALVGAAA